MSTSIQRVALYARVSTTYGQNPEMQLSELREYTQRRGWDIVGEYVDRGLSGSKDSRPALNRLMSAAHQRKFETVLVWKLDRFARSLKHLVNALAEFEALGIAFVSLRDNLDLSTPSGRLMFQIVGAMAEFERALIQERVKAGLAHARARGKRLGRPKVYADVQKVAELRTSGSSWAEICTALKLSKRNSATGLLPKPGKGRRMRRLFLQLSTFLVLLFPAGAQTLPDAPSAFWTKPVVILAIADAGAHAADGFFTQRNLACASGMEHDPLARPFVTHGQPLSSLYFGMTYAGDLGVSYLLHRKRHDRLAHLFLMGAVANSTYGWATSLHGWHGCGTGGTHG